MAKVQFGNLASDVRGTIGGTSFAKNRSGAYSRRKVSPVQRNSPAQTIVRENFTDLSKSWGGELTPAQRTAWNNFANNWPRNDVFGNSIKISGINMYISLGQRAFQIGETPLLDPPADLVVVPIDFDPTSLVADSGAPDLHFNQTTAADANTAFYIFATPMLPPGRQPKRTDFRFLMETTGGTTVYPFDVDMLAAYTALYGALVAGAGVSFIVAAIRTDTFAATKGVQMNALVT